MITPCSDPFIEEEKDKNLREEKRKDLQAMLVSDRLKKAMKCRDRDSCPFIGEVLEELQCKLDKYSDEISKHPYFWV